MKSYNVLYILILFILLSCEKEHGPTLEGHFLNYEIPEVPVEEDYVIGVAYNYTVSSYGDVRYKSLFAKTPILGEYTNIKNSIPGTGKLVVDQHLEWLNQGEVDFLILTIRSGSTANSSYRSDTSYINRILSSPNIGNIKIAFAYDYGGLGLGSVVPTATDTSMLIENKPGALQNYVKDYVDFMAPYFDHPKYMKVDGKNLVFLLNAYRLWSKNNPALTQLLRDSLTAKGHGIYLVGEQETWSPPQRYEHRFRNAVDAIYHSNYLAIATNDLTRLYQFHQVTDQAWKYSKNMFNEWGVEYVPRIGPSRNSNLNSGNAISPYYNPYFEKDSTFFVKYCNVGKLNADRERIILIESWNEWRYDTQIEPAEEYGNQYLEILVEQFKRK